MKINVSAGNRGSDPWLFSRTPSQFGHRDSCLLAFKILSEFFHEYHMAIHLHFIMVLCIHVQLTCKQYTVISWLRGKQSNYCSKVVEKIYETEGNGSPGLLHYRGTAV